MRPRLAGRVTALLACSVLSAVCAARGPSPQTMAELGRADALLREGCYFCLQDALATYERLAAAPRPPVSAAPGAFNAAVLLAVRAKELGLPSDRLLTHAQDLAARLPPPAPGAIPPSAFIDAAAVVIGETSGLDPEERQQRIPRRPVTDQKPIPQRVALELAVSTNIVAEYLTLAIDCDFLLSREAVNVNDLLAKH